MKKYIAVASGGLVMVMFALPVFAATCTSLSSLTLANTTIVSAELVNAGAFSLPVPAGGRSDATNAFADLPAFCQVLATIKPSSDSDIKIEVWLPANDWNGKFQGVGNGAWLGSFSTAALADALRHGYATASTDTGHTGGSASFALGHPEKIIDYGYRAVHEMTLAAKALTTAFYEKDAQFSYFVGCSAGGKQAMKEVQMFPADYDGVVAGSPGLNWSGRALQTIWVGQAVRTSAESAIPREKFSALNAAALAACDGNDGVMDAVIENPLQCHFDPVVLQCAGADSPACLTAAQVETARKIYAPVTNSRTQQVQVAGLSPGSELGWSTMAGAQPFPPGVDLFKYVVFGDAEWDFTTLNWDSDIDTTVNASVDMDAMNPDLQAYFDRGGKIISYHGWADPQISPGSTVAYYQTVLEHMGGSSKVQENYRLFMVPGMNHCGGGTGTNTFDMLTALENWVEHQQTPNQINAALEVDALTIRTRPLCSFPQQATYNGAGSTDEAINFSCQ
ncbi:MAG: tannase/feruloyl esterase family alpha/beta hydrolase [Pseudohongiellaceae bacterium]